MRSIYSFLLILSLFLLLALTSNAQTSTYQRPKIGLVLSGGGAKGLAHIGVLKVLEEAGIRPDYIAGTSMGGIVGGLYAIGYSVDSLEKLAKSTDWEHYLSDAIPRTAITLEEKEDHDRFVLSIPIDENSIKIPGGLVNGQNIENFLNQLCYPVYNIRNFSKFQIPFVCNATDIETGDEVVFKEGYLPHALRATMSIPSIFDPIELDGKLLVDGGLVNNFPANRLKEMGADIIIGVNVGFQSYSKEELNSMFRIIEQSLFFYGEENTKKNRKLCDIVITPALEGFNASSFNSADSIIALGEKAAREIYSQIKSLADSVKAIGPDTREIHHLNFTDSLLLTEIRVEGLTKVSGDLLIGKLQLSVMEKVSPKDIAKAIDRVYSSLYFEKVSYYLEEIESGNVRMIINVIEVSDGSIRFGLHYDSNSKSSILLNTTFRNLLFDGSKFAINGVVGDSPSFKTEFFKNNGWKPGFGGTFISSRSRAYLYKYDRRISSLNFYETKLQIYTQSIFRNHYALGAGIEFENSLIRPVIDPAETIPVSRYNLINYYGFLNMDSYNNAFYPTNGIRVFTNLKLITLADQFPTVFFQSRFSKAQRITDRITLINHLYTGAVNGDTIPSQYLFFTGGNMDSFRNGVLPFAGLDYMEIASRNAICLRMDLQLRFFGKLYLLGTVNAGNFKYYFNDLINTDNILSGYGITAGYQSIVGPIEVSLSRSGNHGGYEGFFRIGYWF